MRSDRTLRSLRVHGVQDGAWAEAGVVDGTRTIDITHTSDLKRLVGGLGYTYAAVLLAASPARVFACVCTGAGGDNGVAKM
jgi:hypothetical protein